MLPRERNLPRNISHQQKICKCKVKVLEHTKVYSFGHIEKTSPLSGPLGIENPLHLEKDKTFMTC